MQDNGVVLLTSTGQESRNVNERYNRNIEGVAETNEASSLTRSVNIEHTSIAVGLVGYDTYTLTIETCETNDNVLGELRLHLEEFTIVYYSTNHLVHVVSLVGVLGDNLIQAVLHTVDGVVSGLERSSLHVVGWDIAQQGLQHLNAFLLSSCSEVCNTRLCSVNAGTTQMLLIDILTSNGLYNLRTGQEHV